MNTQKCTDLRPMLEQRLTELERELRSLLDQRLQIDGRVEALQRVINHVRGLIDYESARLGDEPEQQEQLSDMRLLTMRLIDIAREFQRRQRSKEDMKKKLIEIGYDFGKVKKPGRAVHFAWVGAQRRSSS